MKRLFIALGILAVLAMVFYIDPHPRSSQLSASPPFELHDLVGSISAIAWIVFVVSSILCTFFIDRKKVAEAKFWLSIGYFFPPRKYLTDSAQTFSIIRVYSLITAVVFIVVLLEITP